jgi:hypothetical protein
MNEPDADPLIGIAKGVDPRIRAAVVLERRFETFLQGMPAADRPIGDIEINKVKFIFVSGMIAGAEDFRDYLLRIKR